MIRRHLVHSIFPLCLILAAPNWSLFLMYVSIQFKGSMQPVYDNGWFQTLLSAWKTALKFDPEVWIVIFLFSFWAALSMFIFGGETYHGPATKSGFRPRYHNSGFRFYVTSLFLLALIFNFNGFSAIYWYNKLISMAGALNVYGYIVCAVLYVKGKFHKSPGDYGSSGYLIFDFYWGLELYPRIGKTFDVKLFTNSRFGLMLWQAIVLISWQAQHELTGWNWSMAATSILQTIYLAKFYWWEDGYMKSLDIILDRAGFYICWGCIYFVPTFYTLTSVYMVHNSPVVNWEHGLSYLVVGLLLIFLNYWSDHQRFIARKTDGKCRIWGSPARIIRAKYIIDGDRKERSSLLLASGFWGLSRHINYIFEVGSAFLWELPAQFFSLLPFAYVIFLTILLFHRSQRDEKKCRKKYGKYWDEYCKVSKYRIVPFIF